MCRIRQTVVVDQLSLYLTKCLATKCRAPWVSSFEPCDMLIGVDLNKMPPYGYLTRSFHLSLHPSPST